MSAIIFEASIFVCSEIPMLDLNSFVFVISPARSCLVTDKCEGTHEFTVKFFLSHVRMNERGRNIELEV